MTEKVRVSYPLPEIFFIDRKGGFFESAEALNKRCKDLYGTLSTTRSLIVASV